MARKEVYLSVSGISEKARDWLKRDDLTYRRHRAIEFIPDEAALLVLDMQRYFLESGSHAFVPSAAAIIPGIIKLTGLFCKRGRPVIFTRHVADSSPVTMLSWWNDSVGRDDHRSNLWDELDLSGGHIVEKSTYDAFLGTGLENLLRDEKVAQVVVCGVMTHLCCETTARSAFDRGFFVFFPVDGTATYDEEKHLSTLRNLAHGFAVPVSMDGLAEGFS